jgi:signal transduction histidine kinase
MATSDQLPTRTFGLNSTRPWSNHLARTWIGRAWRGVGLSGQFIIASAVTFVLLFSLAGFVQNRWIVQHLIRGNVEIGAVFMEGIIAPHARKLALQPQGPSIIQDLENALMRSGLDTHVQEIKIWRPDGTILYSTNRRLIGMRFDSAEVSDAGSGETVFAYGDHNDEEDQLEGEHQADRLEIYMPIRAADGTVVAVGEFYQDLATSNRTIMTTIRGSWLIRLVFVLIGILVLFLLVRAAHDTINRQQAELRANFRKARKLARQNQALRNAADQTRRMALQANEELLSMIGSEIHDGPIQLLSLAMLNSSETGRAGKVTDEGEAGPHDGRKNQQTMSIESATAEAILQLRTIAGGLILPEIGELSAQEAIELAIARHERATGTLVEADIAYVPGRVSQAMKACIYRIVQESLTNAARHADGEGQKVEVLHSGALLTVIISDKGAGISDHADEDDRPRLGIVGLKNRVDAFGGQLEIHSGKGAGTRVVAILPIDTYDADEVFQSGASLP